MAEDCKKLTSNKRIAKNTLLLYVRMLFTMCISLYTSRVVLDTLGIENYGIYNVVGGIAALFSFITASMTQTIQRFITFELGKGENGNPQKMFSMGIELQVIISVIIVLLLEIIGLWMLYNKLQIPPNRLNAAFWVLQCSAVMVPISLLSSPYNALIVAHEKMQAFAYISIVEVVLKLLIAYALLISDVDKLILYGVLNVVVVICTRVCYTSYCSKNIKESRYIPVRDWDAMKKMFFFAGWNSYDALSYVGYTQGLNILLNLFFDPVVNAARSVAVQVQANIYSFVANFQTAINPQITKTYAEGELAQMHSLVYRSAKFSFLLLFMLSFPVIIEAPTVLGLWLKTVPEHTVTFVRIIIFISWITTIENPITVAVKSTGYVNKYFFVVDTIRLSIVPIAYVLLRCGLPAYSVFVVHFTIEFFVLGIRLMMISPLIQLSIKDFLYKVTYKVFLVVTLSAAIILSLQSLVGQGIFRLLFICLTSLLTVPALSYCISFDDGERSFVQQTIKKILHK